MVLDPIPQSLPVHFFGSRPQPPTSPCKVPTHHHVFYFLLKMFSKVSTISSDFVLHRVQGGKGPYDSLHSKCPLAKQTTNIPRYEFKLDQISHMNLYRRYQKVCSVLFGIGGVAFSVEILIECLTEWRNRFDALILRVPFSERANACWAYLRKEAYKMRSTSLFRHLCQARHPYLARLFLQKRRQLLSSFAENKL